MSTKVVIGAQWGDEGKAKIIDILAHDCDMVVRSQGGNNAGHTVEVNGEVYKFQLVPSGVLYKDTICVVANGVVIDPAGILGEIDMLESRGIVTDNLKISDRAHVVMPYHKIFDGIQEESLGENAIGTTKKGIGPCYMDKMERTGIRICDLMNADIFAEKVRRNVAQKNLFLEKVYNKPTLNSEEIIEEYLGYAERLRKYVTDTTVLVYEAIKNNKEVLFEGAQGTLLDIDLGTYPFVTSSHPTTGGVCVGSGIGPTMINSCIGVMKAYVTRVGEGPFPTELNDEVGDYIQKVGREFGTVTGRTRRPGWFDAVIGRYAVRTSGLTEIAINKVDVLSGLDTVKICTAYKKGEEVLNDFPASLEELALCEPIYEELKGWGPIDHITSYEALPEEVKVFLKRIEELCDVKVTMIGVGPSREQNIYV